MAGANLLTLIDDIAALLDDVAVMTKVAAKKAAGVLGDDLALNAEQVMGVASERLPVIRAVAGGSTVNKLILVPVALAISAIAPWMVTPLLMLGGGFLCFEGFEKVMHKVLHERARARRRQRMRARPRRWRLGRGRIRGRSARTSSCRRRSSSSRSAPWPISASRVLVPSTISAGMTVGVCGLVAGIVKLDDGGLALTRREAGAARPSSAARRCSKGLGIFGTAKMSSPAQDVAGRCPGATTT